MCSLSTYYYVCVYTTCTDIIRVRSSPLWSGNDDLLLSAGRKTYLLCKKKIIRKNSTEFTDSCSIILWCKRSVGFFVRKFVPLEIVRFQVGKEKKALKPRRPQVVHAPDDVDDGLGGGESKENGDRVKGENPKINRTSPPWRFRGKFSFDSLQIIIRDDVCAKQKVKNKTYGAAIFYRSQGPVNRVGISFFEEMFTGFFPRRPSFPSSFSFRTDCDV